MTFPEELAAVMVSLLSQTKVLVRDIRKIDKRNDEHPYEINEVPVQAHGFHMAGCKAVARVKGGNYQHGDHATEDVKQVQTGDREKGLAKHTGTDGDSPAEEVEPFANVQSGEKYAEEHSGIQKAHRLGLVA